VWALAIAAGCIVSVCYTEFSRVEVGPMTGNTVATGVDLATNGTNASLTRAVAIAAFVVGVAAGIAIAEECARHAVKRVLASTVGAEIVLLVACTWWGSASSPRDRLHVTSHWQLDGLVALAALAMGLQTAALRRVGRQTVRTVYVTGVVTRAAEEAVRYAYWRRDRRQGATEAPWRNEPTLQRLALLAGIFSTYGAGTIAGGWLAREWHLRALVAPVVVLAIVVAVDTVVDAGPPSR
jgi:uncharacterized membrane protein YoaK (UPF0700 family)